jgi:hypothetical protein
VCKISEDPFDVLLVSTRHIKTVPGRKAGQAVAQHLLAITCHLLKRREEYRKSGPSHFDNSNEDRVRRSLVWRLERPGHVVTLQPAV